MAILTINGIAIPVAADTLEVDTNETGDLTGDAFTMGGQALRARTYVRRVISGKTIPIPFAQAATLRRQLYGIGHKFGFDSATLASSRGVIPSPASGTYQPTVGGDTFPVQLWSGPFVTFPPTQYPGGSLALDRARANLVPSNVATGTDTAGSLFGAWAASGSGSVTSDSGNYLSGSRSVAFVTSGGGANVFKSATFTGPTAGQKGQASLYVRGSVGNLTLTLKDGNNTVLAQSDPQAYYSIFPSSWVRIVAPTNGVACTLAAGSYLELDLTGATVNVDQAMAEQVSLPAYPTSWLDGSAGASNVTYTMPSPGMLGSTLLGLAASLWLTQPPVASTVLTLSSSTSGALPTLTVGVSVTGALTVQLGGSAATAASSGFGSPGQFSHVAVTVTPQGLVTAYQNGAQVLQFAYGGAVDAGQYNVLALGGATCLVDDLTVWPFALAAGDVFGVSQSAVAVGQLPFVTVGGDLIGDVPLTCLGRVTKNEYVSAYVQGGFATTHRQMAFELEEY